MKVNPLWFICVLVLPGLLFAQRNVGARPTDSGGPLMPEQAAYDVTAYRINLEIDPQRQHISGSLTVEANIVQPLEWLVLDLDTTMTVSAVSEAESGRQKMRFERRGLQIWCQLTPQRQPGERISVTVEYQGAPRVAPNPPWAGGFVWAKTADGQPWIATAVQMDGADLWWPCKDHPSDEADSVEINITVPSPLVVATNGVLRDVIPAADGKQTWRWMVSNPINNYGIALNIAPYRTITDTYQSIDGTEIPVTFWLLPENVEKGRRLLPELLDHLAFYERMLGPYPFRNEKYGIAETPFYGMEHQTIIAYGAEFRKTRWGFDVLHHHELGHEWWGNLVTAIDWRDFWIHEGFCAYMQYLYTEQLFGDSAYHAAMQMTRLRIRNERPVAPRTAESIVQRYMVPPDFTHSDGDIYNKGSLILSSLRYLLGDDVFLQSLRRFAYPTAAHEQATDGSQCRLVTTDDYLRLVEGLSGKDLAWFFEVYFRQPALPRLIIERGDQQLKLSWETPGDLPFPMPVDVRIDGLTQRLDMEMGTQTIPVGIDQDVAVDPDAWILKETLPPPPPAMP